MFQSQSNSHLSTTSSVYTTGDSTLDFNPNQGIPEDIEEDDEGSIHSENDLEDGDIKSKPSNNTFKTFFTANYNDGSESNPSFTSINNSLLRKDSDGFVDNEIDKEVDNEIVNNHPQLDDDATPKIPASSTLGNGDQLDEKTPILDANPQFSNDDIINPTPNNHLDPNSLPQQDLSKKFKRLSMTLKQSNQNASHDSYHFMNNFQNNIRKSTQYDSGFNFDENPNPKRVSTYYAKINESFPHDDNDRDSVNDEMTRERSFSKADQTSEVSTISNRSSLNSQIDNNEPISTSQLNIPGKSSNESSSSSSFNFATKNKVSPLRIVKKQSIPIEQINNNDDEVPVRRDLLEKSRKAGTGLNIDYDTNLDPANVVAPSPEPEFTENSEYDDTTNQLHQSLNQTTLSAPHVVNPEDTQDDLSTLFVRALHPFDSSTLQSEADASICLAFDKDDLAVIHTIDESGWGEVTLIETLQRGWVPMNYFKFAIEENDEEDDFDDSVEEEDDYDDGKIPNSKYLIPLFKACGKFLINPLSHKNRKGKYTFSIRVINSIRDGVRLLLQETDCLSRSNEIVTKRPAVRKQRKILLADWYNLMIKANDFKGTSNFNKIEVLTLMVYQVIRRAISFLKLWSIESKHIIKTENEKKLQNDMNNYPLLSTPPLAKQRVTEINGILLSYLGLIIGRLDLIEHNSIGCDILENLTHHIILLLRELLFISKTGSDFSSEKPADLDVSLDSLLSLVSDLVTAVKGLVVKTLNESFEDQQQSVQENGNQSVPNKDYYYTVEGGELIQIASKMIRSIGSTVYSIRKLLEITGDFKLNAQRSYPDYSAMKIEPEEFIRKCSMGIAKSNTLKSRQLDPQPKKSTNRYSVVRSGKTGELGFTNSGAELLHGTLNGTDDSFGKDSELQRFTNDDASVPRDTHIEKELLVDDKGNLLGASFKGLVYTLTNETAPPEYFFVSTFFICFRNFATGLDLIEELISRFEVSYPKSRDDVNYQIRLKNRRRLIAKMFQLWLESYWNTELDLSLLTTLINFFNEGMSNFLPLDSINLLEIAAKLSSKPLTESSKQTKKSKNPKQLIPRSITVTRLNRKNSYSHDNDNISSRYSMVDGYELSKINTNSSATNSIKSMSLPMPLGVGNQTSSASSLLTRANINTIEKLILTYRAIIGESWCPETYINPKSFVALDITKLLPNWYSACDQSWVLSNYRPNLLDFNGLEIAKQLTVIESTMFCAIKPEELLSENYAPKRIHLNLAPNVRQSLLFTNCLSGYVIESVLQPKINSKMRLNVIKTWLKVAISCLYLRNFNSLAAIITSLQSHLITRLDRLWFELSDKYKELYEYLSGIIHPDKNYSVYRAKLRNFLVSNDYNIPTVPYFSLFLQDLTFVTDGNSNFRNAKSFLNQKLINIDKYLKITRIIADIESLQIEYTKPHSLDDGSGDGDDYAVVPVPQLQELILLELWKICQLNKKEEDRAWKLSCVIQPRDVQ